MLHPKPANPMITRPIRPARDCSHCRHWPTVAENSAHRNIVWIRANALRNPSPIVGSWPANRVCTQEASAQLKKIVTNDAPQVFPIGTNTVTWTATDLHGNSANSTQQVVVNPAPRLPHYITAIVSSGAGSFMLSFTGAANVQYIVQASSNLLDWANVHTDTAGSDGTWTFIDSSAAGAPSRYYRSFQP